MTVIQERLRQATEVLRERRIFQQDQRLANDLGEIASEVRRWRVRLGALRASAGVLNKVVDATNEVSTDLGSELRRSLVEKRDSLSDGEGDSLRDATSGWTPLVHHLNGRLLQIEQEIEDAWRKFCAVDQVPEVALRKLESSNPAGVMAVRDARASLEALKAQKVIGQIQIEKCSIAKSNYDDAKAELVTGSGDIRLILDLQSGVSLADFVAHSEYKEALERLQLLGDCIVRFRVTANGV